MTDQLVGTAGPKKREQLLAAARGLILEKGYPATTIDQICAAAGVTKGAFFHYFDGKEALGAAALERFVFDLVETFRVGPFRQLPDPLDRVNAYVDFTIEVCKEAILRDGCMLGLFSQELAKTQPDVRGACEQSFRAWANDLEGLLDEAKARYAPAGPFDSGSLAEQFIAIVEGSLILRRAYQDPRVVEQALNHFKDYVTLLLTSAPTRQRRERR